MRCNLGQVRVGQKDAVILTDIEYQYPPDTPSQKWIGLSEVLKLESNTQRA